MAHVVTNDLIVYIDIDDTLVLWDDKYWEPAKDKIRIVDPIDNSVHYLMPHKAHIRLLKKFKLSGYTVVVWSHAGYQWAEAVSNALDLMGSVDFIMSKPLKYIDDLQYGELGSRIYIKPGEKA